MTTTRLISYFHSSLCGFICVGTCALATADVSVPSLFSDHAVMQRAKNVPVWGKATPKEEVRVTMGSANAVATAGVDGKWQVRLDLHAEASGPFDLVIQGHNRLVISDVLVGEVWVCSGQSNMGFTLTRAAGAKDEIASSSDSQLRQFKVRYSFAPVDSAEGKWISAAPETSGLFTALGYYFGKELRKKLDAPVGLILAASGGSLVEAWTSSKGLDTDEMLRAGKDQSQKDSKAFADYITQYRAWVIQHHRQDHPAANPDAFAGPQVAGNAWIPVTIPGLPSELSGLPDAGAIWFRKKVIVPPEIAHHGIELCLGNVRDADTVYWNGKQVGKGDVATVGHRYNIPAELVLAGETTLAVRIFNPVGGTGIALSGPRFGAGKIQVAGEWLAKAEFALPPLEAAAKSAAPKRPADPLPAQDVASSLFNGMIQPLIPYAIRGVVWYQGEANSSRGYQYRTAFPLLIKDWRAQWGQGNLPFYFCQIAGFGGGQGWHAEVREAQTMALSLPNTGQAILIDIGEENNIHPVNKLDAGDRMARVALANTYGKNEIVFSGPVFDSAKLENDKLRLYFRATDGGLKAKPLPATYQPNSGDARRVPLVRNSPDSELEGFAICGNDYKWSWANAKIDGDDVLVSSPKVSKPVAVRYAWSNYSHCNLYNGAGLPAGPFRTDDLPLFSKGLHY